ncbi:MAG: glycosyltransferase [Pseudomonadota bacterium]
MGDHLVDAGRISEQSLNHALSLQTRLDARLGDILVGENYVQPDDILDALSRQYRVDRIDLRSDPPEPEMADALPVSACLANLIVPWRWIGNTLMIATTRPDLLESHRRDLGPLAPELLPVLAPPDQIKAQISRLYGQDLAARAVECVPENESCRLFGAPSGFRTALLIVGLCGLTAAVILAPFGTLTMLIAAAVLCLAMTTCLKLGALIAHHVPRRATSPPAAKKSQRLPRVSVMVPLFKEHEIAHALIQRLNRLTYPKTLLDIVLVLEAKDDVTRQTLSRTSLPHWMSVIEVPDDGALTTKPRALNYALDFCEGDIIGVWDAEDAPEPDQIETVVERFAQAPDDVACLQGRLDYYNARTNWMSRCFAIEYATWWRLFLPGIARLGLVLPLGGTTLFFRRSVLQQLGAWDAHNVTEDADLGIRLARHGYRTELIPTVTMEEANCRPWRWVRQRSRWLKGFMITYLVHMRFPLRLWRDLGPWRFMGIQTMFLATFAQFALAPFLWSFWIVGFGGTHPVTASLGHTVIQYLIVLFVGSEILSGAMALIATSDAKHRHLWPFIVMMPIYFTLGTLAAFKALFELLHKPFYWDKTQHGYTVDQASS